MRETTVLCLLPSRKVVALGKRLDLGSNRQDSFNEVFVDVRKKLLAFTGVHIEMKGSANTERTVETT